MPKLLYANPITLRRKPIASPRLAQMVWPQRPTLQIRPFLAVNLACRRRRSRKVALLLSSSYPLGLYFSRVFDDFACKQLGNGLDGCADHLRHGLRYCSINNLA